MKWPSPPSNASRNAVLVASVLAVLFPLFLRCQEVIPAPPASASSQVKAVPYAQGVSGPLLANLYHPEGPGPFPAIVFIHGGDWISGNRTQMAKLIQFFAARGYVAMAIDYDLSPAVHFPIPLYECKEAVRWLRAHASQYAVDPSRIAVAGSSAGGELAALVALTNGQPAAEGPGGSRGFASTVKTAIIYNAALDLTALPDTYAPVIAYLGGPCSTLQKLCREASPQSHIGGSLPPLFVGAGTADAHIPYAQLTAFVAAYRAAHGPVTVFTAPGGPHTYWATPAWFSVNAEATLTFLQLHL